MIVDFHTHYTPPEFSPQARDAGLVASYDGARPTYTFHPLLSDIDGFLEVKQEAGVDLSVLSSGAGYDATLAQCERLNELMLEVANRYPEHVVCMAHAPGAGDSEAVQVLEHAFAAGLRGLAIASDVSGRPLDDPAFFPVYEYLEDAGQFLFIHPSLCPRGTDHLDVDDLSRSIGREFGLVEGVVRLVNGGVLDRFPDLDVVVSHLGGGIAAYLARLLDFQDRERWGTRDDPAHGRTPQRPFEDYLHDRLLFDTAGSRGDIRSLRMALHWLKPSRIVFGTDCPQELRDAASISAFIDDVSNLQYPMDALEGMLAGTALGLVRSLEPDGDAR